MNTSFEYISEVTGLTSDYFKNYAQDQCHVCCGFKCNNKLLNTITSCKDYKLNRDLKDWWINLKKVIYEYQLPFQNEDGTGIDEDTDATSEILWALNNEEEEMCFFVIRWARGLTTKEAFDDFIDSQQ